MTSIREKHRAYARAQLAQEVEDVLTAQPPPSGVSEGELSAAVGTLTNALATKQDASTAATDTELATAFAGLKPLTSTAIVVSLSQATSNFYADGTSAGNTAAIQAAINAVASGYGSKVVIREGLYTGIGQLTIPDVPSFRMEGSGKGKTTLRFANLTTPAWVKAANATQRYSYRIASMTLDNVSAANAGAVAVDVQYMSSCTYEDLSIVNFETAVRLVGPSYFNRFISVDVQSCTYGEHLVSGTGGGPNENTFLAVKHTVGVDHSVLIDAGNDNHWLACDFEDFLTALEISDIGNTFTNCRIECNDRTGTITYVKFNAGGNNNGLLNCYFSGNQWIDRYTSIVDNGTGNSILALSTYKDQFFKAERNVLAADDMVVMKRSGSGDLKAVYTADDTYANSGSPISYLAKQVRVGGKFFRGLLSGVEKFYVAADGSAYFAGGVQAGGPVDNQWGPSVYGLKTWAFDPAAVSTQTAPTGGLLQLVGMRLNVAQVITHAYLNVGTVGNGTTNAYCALYSAAGALLAQSDDQSANMGATGIKTFTFAAPPTAAAGLVYLAFWATATTTVPAFSRGAGVGLPNVKLGAAYRFATADAALTNAAPANLGAKTNGTIAYWAGLD